jgi:hypothetical protein
MELLYLYYGGIYTKCVSNLVLVRTDQFYVNLFSHIYENPVVV